MYRENEKHKVEFGKTMDQYETYNSGLWYYLPHSCGEWVIGTKKEVRQLISDLEELLKKNENN